METKFCVLTLPRSGSTHLLSLLNSHPQVRAYEELFLARPVREEMRWVAEGSPERFHYFRNKTKWPRPISTLQYITRVHAFDCTAHAIGFKLMIPHVRAFPELLACLYTRRYRVIFLVRQNLLEMCLSGVIRSETGIAHSRETEKIKPVKVDALQLLSDVKRRRRNLQIVETLLQTGLYPWIKVEYEAVRNDPNGECGRIFRFLNVNRDVEVTSRFKRLVTARYDTLLTNYDDIQAVFVKNGLDKYL